MRLSVLLLLLLLPAALRAQIEVGVPIPLTEPGQSLAHPVFSPDGRFIAFTSPSYDGLWIRERATGETWQLTDEVAAGFGAQWSPDGTALLTRVARFVEGRRENAVALFDVTTRGRLQLTSYQSRMPTIPAWSSDGADVAVLNTEGVELVPSQRLPMPGKRGGRTLVANGDALVEAGAGTPVARPVPGLTILNLTPSPDGQRYAFEVMGAGLFVVQADGTGLVSLGPGEHPTWSPDGQWVAFMRVQDDGHQITGAELYAVPARGGAALVLTRTEAQIELFPQWTPDGSSIAYDDLGEGRVYLLPVRY